MSTQDENEIPEQELPGMWSRSDFIGGQDNDMGTPTLVMYYRGVRVPQDLMPNWFDNRVEVAWWRRGVDDTLYDQERQK